MATIITDRQIGFWDTDEQFDIATIAQVGFCIFCVIAMVIIVITISLYIFFQQLSPSYWLEFIVPALFLITCCLGCWCFCEKELQSIFIATKKIFLLIALFAVVCLFFLFEKEWLPTLLKRFVPSSIGVDCFQWMFP